MTTNLRLALCMLLILFIQPAAAAEAQQEKAILVTGASSGIGLLIAQRLADNGFYVYAGARKAADLKRLNAMKNMSAVRLDVTEQADIDAAVAFVEQQGRGLWGVVNNAGVVMLSSLKDVDESAFRTTFDVNVFGPLLVNAAFLPMLEESGGRTTSIGSISGYIAGATDGGYSASKFALEGYTDSLAAEMEGSNVHVSIVEPGGFKSKIRAKMLAQILKAEADGDIELPAERREEMIRTEMGNDSLLEPHAVAAAVVHVMSSEQPKTRYMVTPNQDQADSTMRASMLRLLQLNHDQEFSYSRDELIDLLDELLAALESAPAE